MKQLALVVCFSIPLLCCCERKQAQTIVIPQNNNIDHEVESFAESADFSGSILIAKQGKILYTGAFGLADKTSQKKTQSTPGT